MESEGFYSWGQPIHIDELTIPEVQALADAISSFPFATLLGLRRKGDWEGVEVEFEVQLPQKPPVPILGRERLVIAFGTDEDKPPRVYALRRDFPETIHQNLTDEGEPKQLCLFEDDYREVKPFLTPQIFLQRVGDWLRRVSVEELHLSDQPLEPFLIGAGRIIFDRGVFETEDEARPAVIVTPLSEHSVLPRAWRTRDDWDPKKVPPDKRYVLLPVEAPPWHARLLHHCPRHLGQLSDLLKKLPLDIEDEIRGFISHLRTSGEYEVFREHKLIVLLLLPKIRTLGGPLEEPESWAFLIDSSVADLAVTLGLMDVAPGGLGAGVPLGPPQSKDLETVGLLPLQPIPSLHKAYARRLSGLGDKVDPKIVAIGAGALGSQVILNLARQGFGIWTVVDHDVVLPHNLVRHALSGWYEGWNKANAVAREVNWLFPGEQMACPLQCDVLSAGGEEENLRAALEAGDVILDFSTSHAVSRALASDSCEAGCMSVFLTPNGRYLVVLFEGQERSVRLGDLEMQLAVAIAENGEFHDIYADASGAISYAGSCRDRTVQLAQDWVAVHAGVASRFIKASALSVEPAISIWKWSEADLSCIHRRMPIHRVDAIDANGWVIHLSSHASDLMRYYRRRRQPNETGGVLLGQIDCQRRIIYVGMVLPSPPDSVEWPTYYIRGVEGLAEHVEMIKEMTADALSFVGEWHSHPPGISSQPSADDRSALKLLIDEMGVEGLPGLMMIQGEEQRPAILIG